MRITLQTRFNDYDTRGHVNNAVYLSYFEIARVEAWRAVCGSFAPDFILADAHVTYRSPAQFGEELVVDIVTSEIRSKAWVWGYRILDARDERLVAEGTTTQVMFDYEARTTVAIPPGVRAGLARV